MTVLSERPVATPTHRISQHRRVLGRLSATAVVLVLLFALPGLVPAHVVTSLTVVFALALCAVGFDLAWGFCGIFSFGQALFLGIGGYTTAILAGRHGHPALVENLLLSGVLGGCAAFVVGAFLFFGRRVGVVFLAVSTLVISYVAAEYASSSTYLGGEDGLTGLPYPSLGNVDFRQPTNLYDLCLGVTVAGVGLSALLLRSHFGTVMRAIRADEVRAAQLGYRTVAVKLIVFTYAGVLSAIAGSLYAFVQGGISPITVGVNQSTEIVLWVLIGGSGTLIGGLGGAALLEILGTQLSGEAARIWPIALGAILVLFATRLPRGLLPYLTDAGRTMGRRLTRRRK